MWTRFQLWRVRRKARLLSQHVQFAVIAKMGAVPVGTYTRGKPEPGSVL